MPDDATPPKPRKSASYYAKKYGISTKSFGRWNKSYPQLIELALWDKPDLMGDIIAARNEDVRRETIEDAVRRMTGEDDDEDCKAANTLGLDLPAGFEKGVGLRREVECLQEAARAARGRWSEFEGRGEERAAGKALGKYLELIKELRLLAKEAPSTMRDLDESLDREEVEKTWADALLALRRDIEVSDRKLAPHLEGLPALDIQERLRKEHDRLWEAIFEGKEADDE